MASKDRTGDTDIVEALADGLRAIAEQARELEAKLRTARGTQRIELPAKGLPGGRIPIDPELVARVRKMLESDPKRLSQIVDETGESDNKIKAVITKMQRDGVRIINLGAKNKALWFIPGRKALERLDQVTGED